MKRMTKQILIILAVAGAFVLGGCGDPETPASYSYTVTFDKNTDDPYSTDANPQTKTVTSPATKIDAMPKQLPTRPGHEIDGWYTTPNAASGTLWNEDTPVTANITVYPRWEELLSGTYSVNFDKNGGDTEAEPAQIIVWYPATNIAGNEPRNGNTLPKPPSKAGHLFAGWKTEEDGSGDGFDADTIVTDHIVVYAQWAPIPAGKVAVIFWNKEGTTQLKTVQIDEGAKVAVGDFPDKNTIPYFEIISWKKEEGGAFTSNTTVNATVNGIFNVYINRIKLVGGPPRIVGDTLVHEYLVMEKSTNFAGTIDEEDGTISYTAGAFSYKFPTPVADEFDLNDYAYFIVSFELLSATGNVSGVSIRQYNNSNTLYTGIPASGTGLNQQPWLSNLNGSLKLPIFGAGNTDGFSIRWGGQSGTAIEVKINSIIFYKAAEYTVTFNLDGGAGNVPVNGITVYEGYSIGDQHPGQFPANPTKTGYTFTGWKNEAGTVVTANTPVTGNWALTAQWTLGNLPPVAANVDPVTGTLFAASGGSAATTYTYQGKQWWALAKLPPGTPAAVAPFNGAAAADYTAILASVSGADNKYTRINYDLVQLSEHWDAYAKVTITYDLVVVGGSNLDVTVRNNGGGGDDTSIETRKTLAAGENQTVSFTPASFTGGKIAFVKNNTAGDVDSLFLLRITKVEITLN